MVTAINQGTDISSFWIFFLKINNSSVSCSTCIKESELVVVLVTKLNHQMETTTKHTE